ncbi:hypothetical protein [Clostridium thermarum]|uniref:hypothetical protein n=1 Tax=Clostridium thermarum TaxID=1716543 RepID=UPI0015D66E76|nr:hypothetical protein [Clostridium thermarum]
MVTDRYLINPDFVSWISNATKASVSQINGDMITFSWLFAIVFIAISVGESIMAFVRSRKKA